MPDNDNTNKKRPVININQESIKIGQLEGRLKEKDIIIEKETAENNQLRMQNSKLEREVKQKNTELQDLQNEISLIENKHQKKLDLEKEITSKMDSEIAKLEKQLEKISQAKTSDEAVLKELTNLKLQFKEVSLYNKIYMEELVETKANLANKNEKLQRATSQIESLNTLVFNYQSENASIKNDLESIRRRVKSSFTAEEISNYLNSTVDSFNTEVNIADSTVNYVINGLDVDLKALVYKDEQSGLMFNSPDISSKSEDSLSSVKFSIRAVPKS